MRNVGTPFVAAGSSHTSGFVPDPGSTAGTAKFLCEDGTFKLPQEISDLATTDASFFSMTPFYDPLAIPPISGTTGNDRMPLPRLFGLLRPPPGGRLTPSQGVPRATGSATTTSLYYCPDIHDVLVLWDGTRWVAFQLPEFAIALGTLVPGAGYDVFAFTSTATPSSTDTSTDIVTFASPTGWTTGSVVYPTVNAGGLLFTGSWYYYNAASSTTGSFHTTLANALAGTSKVNLISNVSQPLTAVSMELTAWKNGAVTISNASPGVVTWNSHGLNAINFYDPVTFTTTGALPTGLTANTIYYARGVTTNTFQVAAEPNGAAINTSSTGSGTHTAWTSRARQTELSIQDGRWCKTGDKTRLHLGGFRASSTTQTTSQDGYRYVWNRYNQIPMRIYVNATGLHTYNGGYRLFNNSFANAAHFFIGNSTASDCQVINAAVVAEQSTPAASAGYAISGLGVDRTDSPTIFVYLYTPSAYSIPLAAGSTLPLIMPTPGSHIFTALTQTASTGSSSFVSVQVQGVVMG